MDRIIRMLMATVCIVLYFDLAVTGIKGVLLLTAGIIFLITSFAGFSPIYWMLGFRGRGKTSKLQRIL